MQIMTSVVVARFFYAKKHSFAKALPLKNENKRKTLSLNSCKMKLTEVFFVSTRVMYPVEIKEEA
ncbi:hypothetical protein, partial [Listeria seeligeri]|uniref:hypothetical protein n=1 Tax=Listeria seeligeri TaxID=1640 RepID=UPI0022EAD4A1